MVKEIIVNIEKGKFIGYLLRRERIKQNISLRYLAKYVGIAPQYLSDIELGKTTPSDFVLKKLLEELAVKFYLDEVNFTKVYEYTEQMYNSYMNLDKLKLEQIYRKITRNDQKYEYSLGMPYFTLARLIYCIYINPHDRTIENLIKEVEEIKYFFM